MQYCYDSDYVFVFVYVSDIVCDLGGVLELVNYGEYLGVLLELQIYEYVKMIIKFMIVGILRFDGKMFEIFIFFYMM